LYYRALLACAFAIASSGAYASCSKPNIQPSAAGWEIKQKDGSWIAHSDVYPSLEVPLHMASPSQPEVYEFVTLPRYQNRIGLVQYYAGEPGTSHFVTLVHNAILDLSTLTVIGDVAFTEDCVHTKWTWYDNRVEIDTAYGLEVFDLSRPPEPVMLDDDPDHGTCSIGLRVNDGGAKLRAGPRDDFPVIAILTEGTVIAGCDYRDGWDGIIEGQDVTCSIGIMVPARTPYTGPCRSGWIEQSRVTQIYG
jgi:hypothetical protein